MSTRRIAKVGDSVFVTGTDGKTYSGEITYVWVLEDGTIVPSEAVSLRIVVGKKEHLVEVVPHRDFATETMLTYWSWPGE